MSPVSYQLPDYEPGPIRLYCRDCHRWAQFQRDTLIERFGADQMMPDSSRATFAAPR